MQYNLNEFTPKSTSIYLSEFTQFTPNLTRNFMPGRIRPTGRIGCKSIEIALPVKGHTISMNLHNLHPI